MVLLDKDNATTEPDISQQKVKKHSLGDSSNSNTLPTNQPVGNPPVTPLESTQKARTDLSNDENSTPKVCDNLSNSKRDSMNLTEGCPQPVISSSENTVNNQESRSPAVARICALIQAFHMCTQTSKGKR